MLSGGSPCPVVEHTNTTRGSEIKSAFLQETQRQSLEGLFCIGWYSGQHLHSPHCRRPGATLGPAAASAGPVGRSSGPCPWLSRSGCRTAPKDLAATSWMAGERRSKVTTHSLLQYCNWRLQWDVYSDPVVLNCWRTQEVGCSSSPLLLSEKSQVYCIK